MVRSGLVDGDQVERALEIQEETGERLGEILIDLGILEREDLLRNLARQLSVSYYDLEANPPAPEVARLINARLARSHNVIPVDTDQNQIVLAMADPTDVSAQEDVRIFTGREVEPVLAKEDDISEAIERVFGVMESAERAMERLQERVEAARSPESILQAGEMEEDDPIVSLANNIIVQAVREEASDIHIEPEREKLRVRFRIDGNLREVMEPAKSVGQALVSRIKVMADLDIAERRLPQDGRFDFKVESREYDLRVSCMPTYYGEKISMRLLEKTGGVLGFPELGMDERLIEGFRSLLSQPYGMVLVTGPTGSGKSTTLAAALQELSRPEVNIVTIEDPIEYQIPGVNQTQVNPRAGLDFALALRHFLRQDPDIIMVGEIRDIETAQVAVRAALTGHKVFSTLHTNDAPGALTRLVDMGIEPFLVSSSVIGVMSQRLVRVLCGECRQKFQPPEDLLRRVGFEREDEIEELYRAGGCRACRDVGYRGRSGVFELLVVDEQIQRLVMQEVSTSELRNQARQAGMRSLAAHARQKVLAGETSLEEALKVIRSE